MSILRSIVAGDPPLTEMIKGVRRIVQTGTTQVSVTVLRPILFDDIDFIVQCQITQYTAQYKRWWICDRSYAICKVTTLIAQSAPAALREACEDLHLPITNTLTFDHPWQNRQAIDSYLDVIVDRIKRKARARQVA